MSAVICIRSSKGLKIFSKLNFKTFFNNSITYVQVEILYKLKLVQDWMYKL